MEEATIPAGQVSRAHPRKSGWKWKLIVFLIVLFLLPGIYAVLAQGVSVSGLLQVSVSYWSERISGLFAGR